MSELLEVWGTMGFQGQNIVVTGAAGALGQAVAAYFRDQGAGLVLLDYSDELLQQAYPQVGESELLLAVDLTNREACVSGIKEAQENLGKIDVLANIAGGFVMGDPVHHTSDESWDFLMNLNARSVMNMAAAVVPGMLEQGAGKIINVAAEAGKQGAALMGAYTASKAAVMRLTESMAAELREQHINVNAVMPSLIDTPRNRSDMPDADFSLWVSPSQIASVIGFLASKEAAAVHGACIPVAGLS